MIPSVIDGTKYEIICAFDKVCHEIDFAKNYLTCLKKLMIKINELLQRKD